METITVKEFADFLCKEDKRYEEKLTDGFLQGDVLTRKAAAKMTHVYMKDVLKIKDIEDINPAEKLRDLYDCRTCVNHIAQVYLRGIMDAVEIDGISEGSLFVFDGKGEVSPKEAREIVERVRKLTI